MKESDLGITQQSKSLCRTLLNETQTFPSTSLFRDDVFQRTCEKLQGRNEAMVVRDISLLIVPSAQHLATYGSTDLDCLTESVNEGWNNSIRVTKPRPQPDYSVGFGRKAFSATQWSKLLPFAGDVFDESYFAATFFMYFPFLTHEIKCGVTAGLEMADRQNAHSMTIAVRAVVELFRLVKREKELDREILAFSISHDHCAVRIYGHYAEINGSDTKFYRHTIHKFDFTTLDGKEKWTTYQFTMNVYKNWMPQHLERIRSAIDDIPEGINFEVSESSALEFGTQASGLSQQMGASVVDEEEDASTQTDNRPDATLETSVSRDTNTTRSSKRPRNVNATD
ncbi:MAG: hypothetical protein M1826_000045 [Phylliscum demangeonii]|nr:MAG: hypothetical protein M1826_000045 [Phylliscum demangeonii]